MIFCIMGKSASGKDTIKNKLLTESDLDIKQVVPYTTRPMREGEVEGETYRFCQNEREKLLTGVVIDYHFFKTSHGAWSYFLLDDDQFAYINKEDLVLVGTPDIFDSLTDYFGEDMVTGIFIHADDKERLLRSLERDTDCSEICRRFLADEKDFGNGRIAKMKNCHVFVNKDIDRVTESIASFIREKSFLREEIKIR